MRDRRLAPKTLTNNQQLPLPLAGLPGRKRSFQVSHVTTTRPINTHIAVQVGRAKPARNEFLISKREGLFGDNVLTTKHWLRLGKPAMGALDLVVSWWLMGGQWKAG